MTDNPYRSPESAPEVEKGPANRPDRFFPAIVCGFFGFMGPLISLMGLFGSSLTPFAQPYMALPLLLIPVAVGVAMASWAWHRPKSKWVLPVAVLLVVTGFIIPVFVGILLFGSH